MGILREGGHEACGCHDGARPPISRRSLLKLGAGAGVANGDVSDTMIREQIRVMNESFAGRTGGMEALFAQYRQG